MSKGLSKLQRRILNAIADVTVNTYGTDEPTEAKYQAVFHAVADYWWQGTPAMAGEPRYNSAKVSFSRAVASLIRRGLVGGMALAWCGVPGADFVWWQGGGRLRRMNGYPEDRPRLKLLYLTEAGWQAAQTARQRSADPMSLDAPAAAVTNVAGASAVAGNHRIEVDRAAC